MDEAFLLKSQVIKKDCNTDVFLGVSQNFKLFQYFTWLDQKIIEINDLISVLGLIWF